MNEKAISVSENTAVFIKRLHTFFSVVASPLAAIFDAVLMFRNVPGGANPMRVKSERMILVGTVFSVATFGILVGVLAAFTPLALPLVIGIALVASLMARLVGNLIGFQFVVAGHLKAGSAKDPLLKQTVLKKAMQAAIVGVSLDKNIKINPKRPLQLSKEKTTGKDAVEMQAFLGQQKSFLGINEAIRKSTSAGTTYGTYAKEGLVRSDKNQVAKDFLQGFDPLGKMKQLFSEKYKQHKSVYLFWQKLHSDLGREEHNNKDYASFSLAQLEETKQTLELRLSQLQKLEGQPFAQEKYIVEQIEGTRTWANALLGKVETAIAMKAPKVEQPEPDMTDLSPSVAAEGGQNYRTQGLSR